MLTARRGFATAIDYAALAAPLGLLAGLAVARRRRTAVPPGPTPSPAKVRVLVAAGLTIPLSGLLAVAEATGGSPGKRALKLTLRDQKTAQRPSYPQALTRSLLKTALPWELGHQAVWEFRADNTNRGVVLACGAYAALGWQALAIARGRPTYPDRVAGTHVSLSPDPS